jgi:hypothetical protein
MKRRKFVKIAGTLAAAPALAVNSACDNHPAAGENPAIKEIYEWRVYDLLGNGDAIDQFFQSTLLPVYQQNNIVTGAFQPLHPIDGANEQRHLLFIYPDITTFYKVKTIIWNDDAFRKNAQPFYDQTAPNPIYSNFQSTLSVAFDHIPMHRKPDSIRTLLELRTYRSPNEEANLRKVQMFNGGEIEIFDKTGVNSVLYGEILAGPIMPALMYLTWYENEMTRNNAWKKFGEHTDWKQISTMEKYAYTATDNQSILLKPLIYSQI